MKINKNLSNIEIFQEISKHQVLALMFHDQMYDLYNFLNLTGFKQWHRHQYISESKEFLNTKEYFMTNHNKLLNASDIGQPKLFIPENWYEYTQFDVTPQIVRQYTEISFSRYKEWEENTKHLYEEFYKALMDSGNVADAQQVNKLIQDVTEELDMIYKTMLKLKATGYDTVYILDMQSELYKKYK